MKKKSGFELITVSPDVKKLIKIFKAILEKPSYDALFMEMMEIVAREKNIDLEALKKEVIK